MNTIRKTTRLTQMALLVALIALLALTPLGYLPVGPINATTIHIPVIIGAILLGPWWGAALGGVFGLTSLLTNTFAPKLLSFVFSPLAPAPEGVGGNPLALVIAFVPRILIGAVAGGVWQLFERRGWKPSLGCLLAGFLGSMTNTILVMSGIYFFFGESYAGLKEMTREMFLAFIATTICVNGVVEALVAAVLAAAVAVPLMKARRRIR